MKPGTYAILIFTVLLFCISLSCTTDTPLDPVQEMQSLLEELPSAVNPDYPETLLQYSLETDASGDSIYITQRGINRETAAEDTYYFLFTILSERLHPEGIFLESPDDHADLTRIHLITAENEIGIRVQHMGPNGPEMSMGSDRLSIGAWAWPEQQPSLERMVQLLKDYALAHGDPQRLATGPPSREAPDPWAEEDRGLSFSDLPTKGETYFRPLYRELIWPAYDALGTELEASFSEADYLEPYAGIDKVRSRRLEGEWLNYDEGALQSISFSDGLAQFFFIDTKIFMLHCRYVATDEPEGAAIHFLYPDLETGQITSVTAQMKLLEGDQRMLLDWEEQIPGFQLRLQRNDDE